MSYIATEIAVSLRLLRIWEQFSAMTEDNDKPEERRSGSERRVENTRKNERRSGESEAEFAPQRSGDERRDEERRGGDERRAG